MVEKDDLGGNNQRRAEGKEMPVLLRKDAVEPKSERSVIRGGKQDDVTENLDGTPKTLVLKQFHGT